MVKFKSDIEIARKAKMMPIKKILAKINIPDDELIYAILVKNFSVLAIGSLR